MTADFAAEPPPIQPHPPLRDAWYLTGPTASGKTGVGLELAERIGAEIISLDSMAVYQGMNVGTAKPSDRQRARVPHHLLDVVPPDRDFSLSEFLQAAHRTAGEIRGRGRQVLLVGGTPLYLKSLLRGVFPGPPADWEFRRQIDEELEQVGIEALHQRLEQVDPLAAARLHPHDKRRIVRALEVYKATGRPLSHEQVQFDEPPPDACRAFVLAWPRAQLHQRIERRVDEMFAGGLVEEVRGLLDRYGQFSRTAIQAVGYREVVAHLQGEQDLAATVELVKTRTRQFAKRQMTWFRSLAECTPVAVDGEARAGDIAARIQRMAAAQAPPQGE